SPVLAGPEELTRVDRALTPRTSPGERDDVGPGPDAMRCAVASAGLSRTTNLVPRATPAPVTGGGTVLQSTAGRLGQKAPYLNENRCDAGGDLRRETRSAAQWGHYSKLLSR